MNHGVKTYNKLYSNSSSNAFNFSHKGSAINDVGNWEGGEVKNWSKLTLDSTKNLPTWERGVSKIQKNCRRRLWMVPYEKIKYNLPWVPPRIKRGQWTIWRVATTITKHKFCRIFGILQSLAIMNSMDHHICNFGKIPSCKIESN